MTENIIIEQHETVTVLKLNNKVINALNLEFVHELQDEIKKIKTDSKSRSLVIASSNDKFFSMGFDLPYLYDLERKDLLVFIQTFHRFCIELYTLPKPTIAAITGHAIAGGCILTLCCDYRYIAEGHKLMGLNEIKLGLPIPYPAFQILQNLVGNRISHEIIDYGEFYEPDKLVKMCMVDKVTRLDRVFPEAIENAKILGNQMQDAFAMNKRNLLKKITLESSSNIKKNDLDFIKCWYNPDTREKIKIALGKFNPKKE